MLIGFSRNPHMTVQKKRNPRIDVEEKATTPRRHE
jgi:hypothetical protein